MIVISVSATYNHSMKPLAEQSLWKHIYPFKRDFFIFIICICAIDLNKEGKNVLWSPYNTKNLVSLCCAPLSSKVKETVMYAWNKPFIPRPLCSNHEAMYNKST